MNISKDLWQRTGDSTLTFRKYAFILGLSFFWVVLLATLGIAVGYQLAAYWLLWFIGFFGSVAGVVIYSRSDKPLTSLVGVTMVSFFFALTIGPILHYYSVATIQTALYLTTIIAAGMGLLAMLFPKALKGAGGILFVILMIIALAYWGELILALFGIYVRLYFVDYLAAFLFSMYIWYDLGRAFNLPRTVDNAIDAAGALIIDVLNLFVILLRIFGRRR